MDAKWAGAPEWGARAPGGAAAEWAGREAAGSPRWVSLLRWPRPQPRVLLGFEIVCAWCRPLWPHGRRWVGPLARRGAPPVEGYGQRAKGAGGAGSTA